MDSAGLLAATNWLSGTTELCFEWNANILDKNAEWTFFLFGSLKCAGRRNVDVHLLNLALGGSRVGFLLII